MVEYVEIKVGNNETLVIEDGIIKNKDLTLVKEKRRVVSAVVVNVIVWCIFGKTIGTLYSANSVVNEVVRAIFK